MRKVSKKLLFIFTFSLFFLSACGFFGFRLFSPTRPMPSGNVDSNIANGERIYFTATNQDGDWLSYTGGPNFGGMMMGSYLTCAACHGPEARGGLHTMHMSVMDAPDIRFTALSSLEDDHDEQGSGDDSHADEHAEYDLEDFRLAVIEGKHPDGDFLDRNMPRWEMSDEDLADLFEFISTLP